MEMKVVILRQLEKVGNIVAEEEAVIMTMKMAIKDLRAVAETLVVAKAEVGTAMKKDILRHQWKGGNIAVEEAVIMMTIIKDLQAVVVEEAVVTMMMTIIKDLQAVVVEEAVVTMMMTIIKDLRAAGAEAVTIMKMMTTTKDLRVAVAEEAVMMRKTKTIIKALRAGVAGAAVGTIKMMKIIRRLHEVVEEVRAVMRAEVGSEMRKAIPKHLSKAGSTVVEKEAAAVIMMTTIIKDLRVVVAEVQAVGKAEVGLAMKEDIPGRLGKVGEIVIKFLK